MAIGVRLRDFVSFVEFCLLFCLVLVAGWFLCWLVSFSKTKY